MRTIDYVVLAITITICLNISVSVADMLLADDIDDLRADRVGDIVNQMIAIVALYVGNKLK